MGHLEPTTPRPDSRGPHWLGILASAIARSVTSVPTCSGVAVVTRTSTSQRFAAAVSTPMA
jgi:hypothetical protein